MRSSKYTREVLEPVVAKARSLSDVIRAFGLKPSGGNYRYFTAVVFKAGLDTSHFGNRQQSRRIRGLSRADLGNVVHSSPHFRGPAWAKGETKETHASLARGARLRSLPDDQVFVVGSLITGKGLMPRLWRLGWNYVCSVCGIAEWQGRSLTLHVDHINGRHYDNRLENLRILCALCRARHKAHYADYPVMPRRPAVFDEDSVSYAA